MENKKTGRQTIAFSLPPVAVGHGNVVGSKEGQGPLAARFDYVSCDDYFGEKSWEKAECSMQERALDNALKSAGKQASDLDFLLAGDLLNQCISSSFAARSQDVPFLGLYGACSTMGESLLLAAILIDAGCGQLAAAVTSSHFCTAERQYRFPLEYGGQRPPTAQWTVTGSGAVILAASGSGPKITHATVGKIVDKGITDANNMGAAMAPVSVKLTPCCKTFWYAAWFSTHNFQGKGGSNIPILFGAIKERNQGGVHRMKRIGTFLTGLLVGAALFSGTAAYAAGITAEQSRNRFLVDGQEVQLQAYAINGNNYLKLRDIGEAVGFNVYWDTEQHCVQIESDTPYTGIAPTADKAESTPSAGYEQSESQPAPQAGDVIRCSDGYAYEIKDVSKYNRSMFAVEETDALPTPTCDWSLLVQPVLSAPEARHFTAGGKEYLFVRNLYETKRMQYTLYNAIGSNPQTWKDGKPVTMANGAPMVRINLSIPNEVNATSFWPWRSEQITELFNSCPPGEYSMEAWDVYCEGAFCYTEYYIHVR